jgi:hypothetical protein
MYDTVQSSTRKKIQDLTYYLYHCSFSDVNNDKPTFGQSFENPFYKSLIPRINKQLLTPNKYKCSWYSMNNSLRIMFFCLSQSSKISQRKSHRTIQRSSSSFSSQTTFVLGWYQRLQRQYKQSNNIASLSNTGS